MNAASRFNDDLFAQYSTTLAVHGWVKKQLYDYVTFSGYSAKYLFFRTNFPSKYQLETKFGQQRKLLGTSTKITLIYWKRQAELFKIWNLFDRKKYDHYTLLIKDQSELYNNLSQKLMTGFSTVLPCTKNKTTIFLLLALNIIFWALL